MNDGSNARLPVAWLTGHLDPADADRQPGQPVCWITSLAAPEAIQAQGLAPLSPPDYRDFAGRADGAERLARRRLAKVLVAFASGCRPANVIIGRTPFGGPDVVQPSGWHLSIAGRWPHLAIGAARVPLGVDLEMMTEPPPPDDCFSGAELQALCGSGPGERLRWWCAKESHAKLTGRARQMSPTDIVISVADDGLSGKSARQLSRIRTWSSRQCLVSVATSRP